MSAALADPVLRTQQSLRQLELLVTRKLDGLLQGDHQGLVPGGGSEPSSGRRYEPGDDVRRMDWNLTARSGEPHVRTTIADRELETWLVVDDSASLDFGTAACEKRDLALAAAACFALLTAKHGNRVASLRFGPGGTALSPPRSGRDGALAVLHQLAVRPRAEAGDAPLAGALERLRAVAQRRSLIVIITDLLDNSDWPRQLRALALRHEVVVAEVRDPREDSLPNVGLLTLVDPESGRRLEVQTASAKLRARFEAAAAERRASQTKLVRSSGAGHLVLSTDRDWLLDVVRYVGARRRRR